MLYAILCYHDETVVGTWSRNEDAAVMAKLHVVPGKRATQDRLGLMAALLPTTTAITLRKGDAPVVLDGPFAESNEQLLAFYVVKAPNLDGALEIAKDLGHVTPGAYEIRPIGLFQAGDLTQ